MCERIAADVDMVIRGVVSDYKIRNRFVFPEVKYEDGYFAENIQALTMSSEDWTYCVIFCRRMRVSTLIKNAVC